LNNLIISCFEFVTRPQL